jgi:hypothetical protein
METVMKKKLQIGAAGIALFAAGFALAQAPDQNIGRRHPNLAAAQQYCRQAFDAISAAQTANEGDLGGHAQKAKEYLDRASRELKQAAEYANHRDRR